MTRLTVLALAAVLFLAACGSGEGPEGAPVADYAVGAKGETSDPLAAARTAVEGYGLDPDDVFERAGYPAAEGARVRLIRNGEPLAVVFLMDDGAGKWLVGGVNGCSSLAD